MRLEALRNDHVDCNAEVKDTKTVKAKGEKNDCVTQEHIRIFQISAKINSFELSFLSDARKFFRSYVKNFCSALYALRQRPKMLSATSPGYIIPVPMKSHEGEELGGGKPNVGSSSENIRGNNCQGKPTVDHHLKI